MIRITIDNKTTEYQTPVTFEQLAREYQPEYAHRIVLAIANRKIRELHKNITRDMEVSFETTAGRIGHDTYVRSACMLLMKAICDVAGSPEEGMASMEYTVGKGYYCIPKGKLAERVLLDTRPEAASASAAAGVAADETGGMKENESGKWMDPVFTEQVKQRMRRLVDADLAIVKQALPADEAVELFASQGMDDKVRLFRYRRGSYINVYCLDGYYDYNYGYMVPSTGYLKHFDLIPYQGGMMLLLPGRSEPEEAVEFKPGEKFFATLNRSHDWGTRMGIETVADLNDKICGGDLAELILVQEALQERRIGEIAGDIAKRGNVKFVMIAGPSSSGKTTFSHRLSIQLKTHGLTPHPIAVDDYFVNRDQTPLDENGNYNFECLDAIDVELFNRDMCDLLAGKRVTMPRFNFVTGRREKDGKTLQLGKEDILVIEGIHCLNDRLSHSLPIESKYKIYISALTSLNVDHHNRIATTDARLLRRLVRDARTRGASATHTLRMWDSVRRGEEENIFPFQESADAMFNSALIYELAVLKQFAEPLLYSVSREEPEYFEAKRLLKFLEYFLGVSSEDLPKNSIVREFVGGSCFRV